VDGVAHRPERAVLVAGQRLFDRGALAVEREARGRDGVQRGRLVGVGGDLHEVRCRDGAVAVVARQLALFGQVLDLLFRERVARDTEFVRVDSGVFELKPEARKKARAAAKKVAEKTAAV
jgi:hypothetical protein